MFLEAISMPFASKPTVVETAVPTNRQGQDSTGVTFIGFLSKRIEQVSNQANRISQGIHQCVNNVFVVVLFLDHFTKFVFDFFMHLVVDVEL